MNNTTATPLPVDDVMLELGLQDINTIAVNKPASVLVIEMLGSLVPFRDVVKATGLSEAVVHRIKLINQKKITQLIKTRFGDAYEALLERETITTLERLIEMRDNTQISAQLRLKVCVEILNRAKGTPVHHIKSEKTVDASDDPKHEFAELQKKILEQDRLLKSNVKTASSALQK